MEVNLQHIINNMGPFAMIIAAGLALMAVASLTVFLERLWVFIRSRNASLEFAPIATRLVQEGEYQELLKQSELRKHSHLASILAAGTKALLRARENPGKLSTAEVTRRELVRKSDAIAAEIRRGMSLLASVGSVAPFVGLLGTVVGIIAAFEGIAKEGSGGIGAVSAGIAEALVVTAFGLFVAIPAVLAYNHLTTRADKLTLAVDQAKSEFIDSVESHFGAATVEAEKAAAPGHGHSPLAASAGSAKVHAA
jgi:biopolymer transport protein ExbB